MASRKKKPKPWFELPVAQWIYVQHERLRVFPWTVVVGGFIRAEFATEEEANELVKDVTKIFEAAKEKSDA